MDQGGADDFKKDAGKTLVDFTDDVGILERLVTDGAIEFTGRHSHRINHRSATDAHHVTCDETRTPESESCDGMRNRLASTEMLKAY
jgi:hypothetical protein